MQGGVCLACTTGHDDLATVRPDQPLLDGCQRLNLVLARLLLVEQLYLLGGGECLPVDATILKITEPDADGFDNLVTKGFVGVLAPLHPSGIHDQAAGERSLAGRCEETVDIGFLDAVAFSIELALDRTPIIGAVRKLGYEVNPRIALIEAVLFGPIGKHQDAAELSLLGRRVLKPNLHKALEIGPLLPFRRRPSAIFFEKSA